MTLGYNKNMEYCIHCKKPLAEIETGFDKLPKVLVCVNNECPRVALLAGGGFRAVKIDNVKTKNVKTKKNKHKGVQPKPVSSSR